METKRVVLRMSNDAFFCLTRGEEPLDEAALDEVEQIRGTLPGGYAVETWSYSGQKGFIDAIFAQQDDFDEYDTLSKYWQMQIKWMDGDRVRLWYKHSSTGNRIYKGDFKVSVNQYGHRYFKTGEYQDGRGCLFFLSGFRKRGE